MEKNTTFSAEKTPFIKRMQLTLVILTALLALFAAAVYFISHNAQSSGYTQDPDNSLESAISAAGSSTRRQNVSDIYDEFGLSTDLPGVSGGGTVAFVAPIAVNVRDKDRPGDPHNIVPPGSEVEMSFANLPDGDYRYRQINIKGKEQGYKVYNLSCIRTEDLAALYVSYLEQSGQAEAFESATGLALSEDNALAVLTQIDSVLYKNGLYMPPAYPEYMAKAMDAFRTLRTIAVCALVVTVLYFAFTPGFLRRRAWNNENIQSWNERHGEKLRFDSLKHNGERADVDSKNKNPARQELFKDLYDLDKRNNEYKW